MPETSYKTCTGCGKKKLLEQFSRNRRHRDGRQGQCKACRAKKTREWQLANPEREAERVRRWKEENPERKKELDRRWQREHPERMAEQRRKDRKRNPRQHKARRALWYALERGSMTKPGVCEDCEKPYPSRKIHGHHSDYDKPLEVEWLCENCHRSKHT